MRAEIPTFQAKDPGFAQRVRDSFARQQLMTTLGAHLVLIEPGLVEIEVAHSAHITQQHGYIHAGAVASVLDSACGYAAYTLMPADAAVLSIEFKVNLLAPALGERLIARARVKRAGRTITVCDADAFAVKNGEAKLVATMLATMMCVEGGRLSG
jgi:uncharacterized protein (TIGR00369 family)